MSAVKLNEEEFALLDGVTNLMFRLYVILRRHMDYTTGKAGEHHRITWASVAVEMNIDVCQGPTTGERGRPGREQLRRAGARLEKKGLLQTLSTVIAREKRLIFFFHLAARDDSARKKPDRHPTDTPDRPPTTSKTNDNKDMADTEKINPTVKKSITRPYIRSPGKRLKKNEQKKSAQTALDYSSWPAIPSQQIMDDWLAMRKAKRAQVSQTVVARFGKQLQLAGMAGHSVDDCLGECIERNWLGFKAEWITNQANRNSWNGGKKLSAVEQALEDLEETPSEDDGDTIDGEALH